MLFFLKSNYKQSLVRAVASRAASCCYSSSWEAHGGSRGLGRRRGKNWEEAETLLYGESLCAPGTKASSQSSGRLTLAHKLLHYRAAGRVVMAILTCQTLFCSWKGTRRTGSGSCPGCCSKSLQLSSYGFLLHIHRHLRRNTRKKTC